MKQVTQGSVANSVLFATSKFEAGRRKEKMGSKRKGESAGVV